MSLRIKVSLLIIIPVLVVLVFSAAFAYTRERERSLANMSLLAAVIGHVIEDALEQDMLASDFESLQGHLDAIGKDSHIETLFLLDVAGRVIFSPQKNSIGTTLSNTSPPCIACHREPPDQRPSGIVITNADGAAVFRSMQPIINRPPCSACHDPAQRIIGLLLTDISISPFESGLQQAQVMNIAWWSGSILLTALLAYLGIERLIVRRVRSMISRIEQQGIADQDPGFGEHPDDEIGQLGQALNLLSRQVHERDGENKALSQDLQAQVKEKDLLVKKLITAQEEERVRLARELHDDLGQSLASMALSLELTQRSAIIENPDLLNQINQIKAMVGDLTDRMYAMIIGLRPSSLDDLGLNAALQMLAERLLQPARIDYEFDVLERRQRLPSELETALFRIFQEALSNIVKHAAAKHVVLKIRYANGMVVGRISDDGGGFDPAAIKSDKTGGRGLGLLGMRERAEICGGSIQIDSAPGRGTSLVVRIPVTKGPTSNAD